MSRPNPILLLVFLLCVIGAMGGVAVSKGAFLIAKHEGDTLHLLQILFRMMDGEWPHLDFMTPIGILSFLPITAMLKTGMGVGMAILWSQILVALVLLLPTWWVMVSRFRGALAYLFGAVVMVFCLALVHGETDQLVSVSMHYNRWAWAVSYIVIATAVLPAMRRNDLFDGSIIGLGMAVLLLAKVTYFISFLPAVALALILRREFRVFGIGVVAGVAVMAVMTVVGGIGFWVAYLGDLVTVASTEVRPAPGLSLRMVMASPAYIGGTLVLFLGVIFLRQAGQDALGLLVLVLAPGFIYVAYQNSGNDPQWLMLLAILLLAPKVDAEQVNGFGWPMAKALSLAAVAAIAFAAPSTLNLTYSPFRHAAFDVENYQPLVPGLEGHEDLKNSKVRANRMDAQVAMDDHWTGFDHLYEVAEREASDATFQGESFRQCELRLGLTAWFQGIMTALEATEAKGKRVYIADLFSSFWLFGAIERLTGGAPWYYGGLPGFDSADYLLIPDCPASPPIRKLILEAVTEAEIRVTEIERNQLFVLYEINR